jgi:hypothetical protein
MSSPEQHTPDQNRGNSTPPEFAQGSSGATRHQQMQEQMRQRMRQRMQEQMDWQEQEQMRWQMQERQQEPEVNDGRPPLREAVGYLIRPPGQGQEELLDNPPPTSAYARQGRSPAAPAPAPAPRGASAAASARLDVVSQPHDHAEPPRSYLSRTLGGRRRVPFSHLLVRTKQVGPAVARPKRTGRQPAQRHRQPDTKVLDSSDGEPTRTGAVTPLLRFVTSKHRRT